MTAELAAKGRTLRDQIAYFDLNRVRKLQILQELRDSDATIRQTIGSRKAIEAYEEALNDDMANYHRWAYSLSTQIRGITSAAQDFTDANHG